MGRDAKTTAISRRRAIKAIGATASIGGLAGCGGNSGSNANDGSGDGGSEDGGSGGNGSGGGSSGQALGERVPPIVISYLPDFGPWQETVPIIKSSVEEAIDHEVILEPKEISAFLDEVYNDQRTYHYSTWGNPSSPSRLDPGAYMRRQAIDYAGPNGQPNYASYANCEYSDLVIEQATIGDAEERKQTLWEAMSIFSNDIVDIPIVPRNGFTVGRNDMIDVSETGEVGMHLWNNQFFVETTATSGSEWVFQTQTEVMERRNHLAYTGASDISTYVQLVYSGLVDYDKNWELYNLLAEDYTVEDGSRYFEFTLREGATFHNGDSITAEDVKFTMELVEDVAAPLAQNQNYSNIEVIDDQTIIFEFEEPNPQFLTTHLPMWGVVHPPTWENIDNFSDFEPDPIIGSGPYQVSSFSASESIVLEPHDGHPVYDPTDTVIIQYVPDKATRLRAVRQGEAAIADNITGKDLAQMEEQLGENYQGSVSGGFGQWHLYSSYPRAPVRYTPFADAVGKSINRQEISQVVFAGKSKPQLYALMWTDRHPFWPPEDMLHQFTDQATGDPEAARQALTDAGWGWDDNGNLRYPEGTNTAPLWPKDETPSPEDFPCINGEGEYVPSENR